MTAPQPTREEMPTDAEHREAWKAAYVAEFVRVGVDPETAIGWFNDQSWEDLKEMTPQEAAHAEMQYWDAE